MGKRLQVKKGDYRHDIFLTFLSENIYFLEKMRDATNILVLQYCNVENHQSINITVTVLRFFFILRPYCGLDILNNTQYFELSFLVIESFLQFLFRNSDLNLDPVDVRRYNYIQLFRSFLLNGATVGIQLL